MPIELADIALPRVHRIATVEDSAVARLPIPGLDGDMVQYLGRHGVRLRIDGIFYGPEAAAQLDALRALQHAGEPVDFLADIAPQTYVGRVLIERLHVWQQAGLHEQFSYALQVVEYVEPPEPTSVSLDAELKQQAQRFMALANLPVISDPVPASLRALRDLESAVATLEHALEPLRPIFGLVTPKSVHMQIVDKQGKPIDNVTFAFIGSDGTRHSVAVEGGVLEVDALPEDEYLILPEP